MILGIVLLVAIFVLYHLVVRGWLWRVILYPAGWYGIYYLLLTHIAWSADTVFYLNAYPVSWAILVPSVVVLMCLLTTKG